MDSMEVNKACAAVLVAGITFMIAGLVGDGLVHPKRLAVSAIKIDMPAEGGAAAPAVAAVDPPVAVELVSADPAKGEALVKGQGCVACHSFNEGGKAGVGPNLYGVLGAPHGHMVGYEYSAALKAKQGPWTYDELYDWLKKPAAYAPGTKMSYAGLADPAKRADIIDYLRSLSHSPEALPAVPAAAAASAVPATATAANVAAPPPGGAAPAAEPIEARLVSADPSAGQKDTLKLGCIACHSFNQGGKAGLGPNLYGVVGGPHAHMEGFQYSAALKGPCRPMDVRRTGQVADQAVRVRAGDEDVVRRHPQPVGAGGRDRLPADERRQPGAATWWRHARSGDGGPRRTAPRARTGGSRAGRRHPSRAPTRKVGRTIVRLCVGAAVAGCARKSDSCPPYGSVPIGGSCKRATSGWPGAVGKRCRTNGSWPGMMWSGPSANSSQTRHPSAILPTSTTSGNGLRVRMLAQKCAASLASTTMPRAVGTRTICNPPEWPPTRCTVTPGATVAVPSWKRTRSR